MVRKIVVEFDVETDAVSSGDMLSQFKSCLQETLASLNITNYALRDDESRQSVADMQPASRQPNDCTFQIGTMTFNVNTNDISGAEFIKKCVTYINQHIEDEKFNLKVLAGLLNLSKPTFYRKIKMITGASARDFIRKMKMQIAYQLLATRNYTVSEVAYRCGYANARHFSKTFFDVFNIYPSRLLEKNQVDLSPT